MSDHDELLEPQPEAPEDESQNPESQLDFGTYEVIRNRLRSNGAELSERLDRLNQERRDVFGSIETQLISTERVTTSNNCVPRDLVAIGSSLLLGYNVQIGLRSETHPEDVFAVYSYDAHHFRGQPLDLIDDERFRGDFRELYRYYKRTMFVKFSILGPHLYMVFRVGAGVSEIKTFKWLIRDSRLEYVDNRSDHEFGFPPQHDFEWKRTHRDLHRAGIHPHVSIQDRVFVETVGGDLTIKVEDNTASGEGIYSEPVEDPDQTLDDADYFYAIQGNTILMRIRPYREEKTRYFVYNEKVKRVHRLDAIESSCVSLPDDHGFIFSRGYYLHTGELKTFDTDHSHLIFEKRWQAANGEDYLYVFYQREFGVYVLLAYNVISQSVATPILCNGYTICDNGELIYFKTHEDPQKHHALQIWQTPFLAEEAAVQQTADSDSYLFKVGNHELVRGMAECHEIVGLTERDDSYEDLYVDLVKRSGDVIDTYFWIQEKEAHSLGEVLREIQRTAASAVSEFEKVAQARKRSAQELRGAQQRVATIGKAIAARRYQDILDFTESLSELRRVRGEIISLRDLRYMDREELEKLEQRVVEHSSNVAQNAVSFLLQPGSLEPYRSRVVQMGESVEALQKVSEARGLDKQTVTCATELEMLIETITHLEIEDATQRTDIIDRVSNIFSELNKIRARIKRRSKELGTVEGAAEFASQLKLLGQAVVNSLDLANTPQRCDESLTKLMIQIEELEARFAESDEFVEQLAQRRQEVYDAIEARKVALTEARTRKAESLYRTAQRILKGLQTRVSSFDEIAEIHAYVASDLMVEKLRNVIEELVAIEDPVKADELQGALKRLRENAVRQLRDKKELFVDGENVLRFGQHAFSVNTQPLDLTMIPRQEGLYFHLTGTGYFDPISDEAFLGSREIWEQEFVSENAQVYRGEYLAYVFLREQPPERRKKLIAATPEEIQTEVTRFMGPRYREGYSKGVHDHDAALIVRQLLRLEDGIGLLRFCPEARALAEVTWRYHVPPEKRIPFETRLRGFAALRTRFLARERRQAYVQALHQILQTSRSEAFEDSWLLQGAEYLFELLSGGEQRPISAEAAALRARFEKALGDASGKVDLASFRESIDENRSDPDACLALLRDWIHSFLADELNQQQQSADENLQVPHAEHLRERSFVDEVACSILIDDPSQFAITAQALTASVNGLLGDHPMIEAGSLLLDYARFQHKLTRFQEVAVARFEEFSALKKNLLDSERERLRLSEFEPKVLTSFVRNQLIDRHYLPLIGANLAKQMGTVGTEKRTDLMGLLLLVSPPGYGKTTLMEYVAHRLGLTFVKINGPALGHSVRSLDPAECTNASSRSEIEKLNLAFEMGDNVMIYLDDIQHTHAELLQKFISLCDGQRKIEGVFRGRPRTYDLRGRKVAVVMAGNPYTESGEKFQIPDMLANRADTYNLGDVIGGNFDAFQLSYIENAVTSNPTLNVLASGPPADLYALLEIAESRDGSSEGVDLQGNFSAQQVEEIVSVLRKLMRIRDVVLRVNAQYVASAAQSDDYRTEPPFALQGSYRNMNKLAERVLPIMNDSEIDELIMAHYQSEAQTLTSAAEGNLLKLKEILGVLSADELTRWSHIKETFARNLKLRGLDQGDSMTQLLLHMEEVGRALGGIQRNLEHVSKRDNGAVPDAGVSLDHAITRLCEALERGATPPELRVVNKVPHSFLNVIQRQFAVMQGWMLPMVELLKKSEGSFDELEKRFDHARHEYEELLQLLERGEIEGTDSG